MYQHIIDFKCVPREPSQVTKITSLHKLTSGVFNISGVLKWNREPHIPSEITSQMVRDSTFTDSTGSMPLSVKTHFRHGREIPTVVSATSMANAWPTQN